MLGDLLTQGRFNWGPGHSTCFSETSLSSGRQGHPPPPGSAPAPPPQGLAQSVLDRVESLRAAARPAQQLKINTSSLAASRQPSGSGRTILQCSLEPLGRWAGLGTSSSGRRLGRKGPALSGQRKETWQSVSLDGGVLRCCVSKQEARPGQPQGRKISSEDLFLESGRTLLLSRQWNLNLKLTSLLK